MVQFFIPFVVSLSLSRVVLVSAQESGYPGSGRYGALSTSSALHTPNHKDNAILSYVTNSPFQYPETAVAAYSDRRNFDRDGLMVNAALANGLYGGPGGGGPIGPYGMDAPEPYGMTPSPLLASNARNYPLGGALSGAGGAGGPYGSFSGYLPNGEGMYYGSQSPNHQSMLMYSAPESPYGPYQMSYSSGYGGPFTLGAPGGGPSPLMAAYPGMLAAGPYGPRMGGFGGAPMAGPGE